MIPSKDANGSNPVLKAKPDLTATLNRALTTATNPRSFVLPLLLCCLVPVLLRLIWNNIPDDIFRVWMGVFFWSGELFLGLFPSLAFGASLYRQMEAGNLAAIALVNAIPITVVSALVYIIFTREFAPKRRAIGLAIIWGILVVEIIGAIPFGLFALAVSNAHGP